ncbi:MAG: 30S ribosomal protein S17 [Candidatus Latescibacterota bacterium]
MAAQKRGRRTAEGRVVKANNIKTRVVVVDQSQPHELYGRVLRRSAKLVAHDEKEQSSVGDLVRVEECRPMSRTKRWRLVEVLERTPAGDVR